MAFQRNKSTKLSQLISWSQTSDHLQMDYNLRRPQNIALNRNEDDIQLTAYFTSCQFLRFTFTRPYINLLKPKMCFMYHQL